YHSVLKKGDITMGKMMSPKVPGFTGCCSGLCRVQAPAQPETYCSGAQCVFGLCSHYLRCPVLGVLPVAAGAARHSLRSISVFLLSPASGRGRSRIVKEHDRYEER
ncbi:TPA: hypothetical protein ACHGAN_000734, partial [Escherichia coli]